jgi:hypothetical protein
VQESRRSSGRLTSGLRSARVLSEVAARQLPRRAHTTPSRALGLPSRSSAAKPSVRRGPDSAWLALSSSRSRTPGPVDATQDGGTAPVHTRASQICRRRMVGPSRKRAEDGSSPAARDHRCLSGQKPPRTVETTPLRPKAARSKSSCPPGAMAGRYEPAESRLARLRSLAFALGQDKEPEKVVKGASEASGARRPPRRRRR